MPHSLDQDTTRRFNHGRPDPFASLGAAPARRRFWLIELLMAPFQDHDERASYRAAKKNGQAKNGNGANHAAASGYAAANGVARNGNGGNGHDNGYTAPAGRMSARNGNGGANAQVTGNGMFSAGARRPLEY